MKHWFICRDGKLAKKSYPKETVTVGRVGQ